jgi:hypothetical protein
MNTANNDILKKNDNNNKCDKCNLKIHPNFIGYHKCGYANCSICKKYDKTLQKSVDVETALLGYKAV